MKNEKDVNYTPEMEKVLIDAANVAPIDYDRAKELGIELKRNPRSVIAKVKRMKLDYKAKDKPEAKRKGPTKADIVKIIEAGMDSNLEGLEKAPVPVLQTISAFVAADALVAQSLLENETELAQND